MGTAQRSGRARGRPLGAPCPAPGLCRPAWGHRCHHLPSLGTKGLQRDHGDASTAEPARPRASNLRDGGTAPAGHSPECSSGQRDPSLAGPEPGGTGEQGLPVAVAGTHRHTDRDTCYINGCQHLPRQGGSRGCRGSGAAGNPPAPRHPPPHPLPVPSSAAGTRGRGQITTHPNLPKGLLHGAGSSAFPLPGQG